MKTKYYLKLLLPLCAFGMIFRVLEIMFAIEPENNFYITESIIPLLFNIYVFLVIVFLLSGIFLTKPETKTVRKRFGGVTIIDKLLVLATAVFVLAESLQDFLTAFLVNKSYDGLAEAFRDFPIYVLIFAFISCVFMVFFVSNPKKNAGKTWLAAISLAFPLYYAVRLFRHFMDLGEIMSKAYGSYMVLFLGFIVLALLNVSKMLAGTLCKRLFTAFGLCAAFIATIHIVDFAMSFLPGNPYNITVDLITYIADFLCAAMILRFVAITARKADKAKNKDDGAALAEGDDAAADADQG